MTTYTYHCAIDRLFEKAAVVDERTYSALVRLMELHPSKFHAIRLVIIESAEPLSIEDLRRRLSHLAS